MMYSRLNTLLLLLLTITLTACGFHARGGESLPAELKNVYLEGGTPALRDQMLLQLRTAHAQLVSRENASMVITLFDEQFRRRGVSLSERGKTNEYELIYQVEYELSTPKNVVLLPRQPLEIRRDYYNDQQAILARDNEENVLRAEMTQQVIRTLLNQVRFTLAKSEK